MTNEEFIKLIDEEIADCNETWDIYYELNDRERCKKITAVKLHFELFKRKVEELMKKEVV